MFDIWHSAKNAYWNRNSLTQPNIGIRLPAPGSLLGKTPDWRFKGPRFES